MADQAKVGLFPVGYRIGNDIPGAPLFTVHLVVNAATDEVNGAGTITSTANPPLDVHTTLRGDFTYMTVISNNSSILLVLDGVGHIGPKTAPLIGQNVRLRAILSEDWKTGTATYSHSTDGINWIPVKDVPMELLS